MPLFKKRETESAMRLRLIGELSSIYKDMSDEYKGKEINEEEWKIKLRNLEHGLDVFNKKYRPQI